MDAGLALFPLMLVETRVRGRALGPGTASRPSAMHPVKGPWWALVGRRCGVMVVRLWRRLHAGTRGSKEMVKTLGPQEWGGAV